MKNIFLSIIIFLHLFFLTTQLSCSTNCSIIQVKYSDSFIEPTNHNSCINTTSINICKGQIIAYYNGKNFPKYINYTFGTIGDTLERKNENDINTYGLVNFTKYQVIVNAKNEETIIVADIYCTIINECALFEIKKLFFKYNHQLNPFYELKSLIYVDPPPTKLHCFDISIDKSQQCSITTNYPVCLSYSKDLRQECSVEFDIHIHEEFIITSPEQVQFNLMNELVRCNKDNCNTIEILTKIQNISRSYAYGNIIRKNNSSQQQQENIHQIFYLFVFIVYLMN